MIGTALFPLRQKKLNPRKKLSVKHAQRNQPQVLIENHAQRCARRQAAIRATPLYEITRRRVAAPALVIPHKLDPSNPRLSPTPNAKRLAIARSRSSTRSSAPPPQPQAELRSRCMRPFPRSLKSSRPPCRKCARPWPAQKRRNVLNADYHPSQRRVHAHAQMHKRWQNRQWQPDREIANERKVHVAQNRAHRAHCYKAGRAVALRRGE